MLQLILHSKPEKALVAMFRLACAASARPVFDEMPWFDPTYDRIVYEMPLTFGRADIVIFHLDGTATVIEAKDGGNGATHVAQGIGQAALYATQISLKGSVSRVRKALVWTSAGVEADAYIDATCEMAGVTAIPFASLKAHRAEIAEG